MHRALLVALTLSLSGNVALLAWALGRDDSPTPAPKPASVTPLGGPAIGGPPTEPTPPPPWAAPDGGGRAPPDTPSSGTAPALRTAPVSSPMPRGLDWCGTGREAYPPPLLGPKWRIEDFNDDLTRARMANDKEWNALLVELTATDHPPGERLALMRAFLLASAGRLRRADVSDLAHCLGTIELARKAPANWIVERLYRAAKALRRSVNENWLPYLDPPPPPPAPARPPGR